MSLLSACNDACTGVLLDDLDKLHNIFLTVNVSAIVMAPYGQMVALENQTRGLQVHIFSSFYSDDPK